MLNPKINVNGLATPERMRKRFCSRNHDKMGSVPKKPLMLGVAAKLDNLETNGATSISLWCGLTIGSEVSNSEKWQISNIMATNF